VSLARLHLTPGSHEVVYVPKVGHHDIEPTEGETWRVTAKSERP
jgi:hypothetical protein